jgi:hypothetical protein
MANQPVQETLKSALLPGLDYDIIQHILEWFIITLIATIISMSISYFFLSVAKLRINRDRHAKEDVEKFKKFFPLLKALLGRHNRLSADLAAMNAEVFQKTRAHERASLVLSQMKKRKNIRVRFANLPNRGLRCFSGYVYNEHVRKFVAKDQHYPLLDDEWATPQLVEVWCDSLEAAEQEIYKKYTKAQGFIINNLEKVRPPPTKGQILNERDVSP